MLGEKEEGKGATKRKTKNQNKRRNVDHCPGQQTRGNDSDSDSDQGGQKADMCSAVLKTVWQETYELWDAVLIGVGGLFSEVGTGRRGGRLRGRRRFLSMTLSARLAALTRK